MEFIRDRQCRHRILFEDWKVVEERHGHENKRRPEILDQCPDLLIEKLITDIAQLVLSEFAVEKVSERV